MTSPASNAYCGPAPAPTELWTAWNLDPVLLAAIGGLGAAFIVQRSGFQARALQAGAITLFVVIFISPLCALTTALFSARALHHILLVTGLAPLLIVTLRPLLPMPQPATLTMPFLVHALVLWAWHAPGLYAWALSGTLPYWLMELVLLGSALWLWRGLLAPGRNPGLVLVAGLGTIMQMGFLGAILTFANAPLYAPHLTTTDPFGLSALADQQLGGLIMWLPAALPYIALALWVTPALLKAVSGDADKASSWSHG